MRQILLALLLVVSSTQINAQGIEFFEGTFDEALSLAKAHDKIIFVDAYTTWCAPCKRMAKQVFTLDEVGSFYNGNFINMKIDMEKTPGLAFQRKYPVQAFPTFYFIDSEGKALHVAKGGRQPAEFIGLGKTAMSKNDKSGDYAKAYEEGNRDPELVYNYVKALNKVGKPSLKIANDYINSQKDKTTEQNLKFILEAAIESDSRIFSLLMKYRPQIETVASKQAVDHKIELACNRTVSKAIEFQSMDLLKEAKEKMKAALPGQANAFASLSDMRYYFSLKDASNYLKSVNNYVKKEAKNDPHKLHQLSSKILRGFPNDEKSLKQAEKYAKKAAEKGNDSKYHFSYASLLFKLGKKKDALASAEKALEMASGDKNQEAAARNLIKKIQG